MKKVIKTALEEVALDYRHCVACGRKVKTSPVYKYWTKRKKFHMDRFNKIWEWAEARGSLR